MQGPEGEDRPYHPRGMATCLRCGHLVRVASHDGADVELVDPERRAAGRWAGLASVPRPRALTVAERREGHMARCFALDLRPRSRPEVIVEGHRLVVERDLGLQWTMPGRGRAHVLYVAPESGAGPMPGPGRLLAYRYPDDPDPESAGWRLWPWRDRTGYPWMGEARRDPAPIVVASPPPAHKPDPGPAARRLRIAGVPYRKLEYLGHQALYRGWAWKVTPWGSPDDGSAGQVAIKRPGESAWRIARMEDRIGGGATP